MSLKLNKKVISEQFKLVTELSHTNIYTHNSLDIIMTVYKENSLIDIAESIETIEHMKPYYSLNKSTYGIVYPAHGSVITDKARTFWSKNEFIQENTIALAAVYFQLAHRLIILLFIKFNKPKTPMKVFNNIESAIHWLIKEGCLTKQQS
jgi:hypothetical protein